MVRTVHVLGLQRLGTNYLAELCRLNLGGVAVLPSGDRTVCWKHALPGEATRNASHTGLSAGDALRARPDVTALLICKHPFNWIASLRRNPADLFLKRPALLGEGEPDIGGLMGLYADYYGGWLDLLNARGGYLTFRYEQALAEPLAAVTAVAGEAGVMAPERVETLAKAPFSRTFRESDRRRYADFAHGLSPENVRAVEAHWPAALLARMGYGAPSRRGRLFERLRTLWSGAPRR